MTPGVSVIVPTYERRELVREAIESVRAQTYRDFELIVIDDGSTDGTSELLESLGRREPRLRHRRQENRGVAAARNAGIGLSRAPVVAFLDSDNLWRPNHLASLVEMLERHPEAVAASTCAAFELSGCEAAADAELIEHLRWPVFTASRVGFTSCTAVRRDALDRTGGFDERLPVLEDTDLWQRLTMLGPFCVVRAGTVVRRVAGDSVGRRAQESGEYLVASELSAGSLLAAAGEGAGDADGSRLAVQARGLLSLARALRALDRGEEPGIRPELVAACERLPRLSRDPEQITWRLREQMPGIESPGARARVLGALARSWPDRRSATAHHLRAWGIGAALRSGRPLEALRLASGWRPAGTGAYARFLVSSRRRKAAARRRREERRRRQGTSEARLG